MDQLGVGNLERQDEEEAVDAVEARRDIEVAPGGMSVAVLEEERLHHGSPVVWLVLRVTGKRI